MKDDEFRDRFDLSHQCKTTSSHSIPKTSRIASRASARLCNPAKMSFSLLSARYLCSSWIVHRPAGSLFLAVAAWSLNRTFWATGEWKKLLNEELHDLYSSPSIITIMKSMRMRWAGHVARMGEKRNVYRLLVGKPGGRRPLGRPRRRWLDNIRMDVVEVG
jgi:hypothetical protein